MTKVLVAACEQLAEGLEHLPDFKGLDRYWIEIHRLENEGDRISRDAVASLFSNGIDPMVVIRWKDMFAVLENAIDATETAAQIIEGIVIKNLRDGLPLHTRVADSSDVIMVIVVGTALAFDFTNGFHDTANVVATAISTGAAQAAGGDRRGRAAQLRRRLHLDLRRRDGRQRRGRGSPVDHADCRLRRADRGHRLESDHLVLRPAVELLARADRWRRRRRHRGRRLRRGARATASSGRS